MTIFQRCRKVVAGSFGLEKAKLPARHQTSEQRDLLLAPASNESRAGSAGAVLASLLSMGRRRHD